MYEYRATVIRWIDADTIVVNIDLGFREWKHEEHLRLIGINAPDKQPAKHDATVIANQLCPAGSEVTVRTEKDRQEKYGRWLATVLLGNGANLNMLLVLKGTALPWDGTGTRPEAAA